MAVEKYKIKYRKSDGEILELGSSVSDAGPSEAIEDFIGEHPGDIALFKRTGAGVISEKSQPEKDEYVKRSSQVSKDKFKQIFNGSSPARKEKIKDELFAIMASRVLTESDLEGIV